MNFALSFSAASSAKFELLLALQSSMSAVGSQNQIQVSKFYLGMLALSTNDPMLLSVSIRRLLQVLW